MVAPKESICDLAEENQRARSQNLHDARIQTSTPYNVRHRELENEVILRKIHQGMDIVAPNSVQFCIGSRFSFDE